MPSRRVAAIELATVARDAALAVDGVDSVTAGPGGYGATYGPGRRIDGIRVRRAGGEIRMTVAVCLTYPSAVTATAREVRAQIAAALRTAFPDEADVAVTVQVVDLAPAGQDPEGR